MEKIKKLFLVDDSESTNLFNKTLLQRMNIANTIKSFADAKTALLYLRDVEDQTHLPELILLDLSMPKIDGFDFLEEYIKLDKVVRSDFKTVIAIVSNHLEHENFEKVKRFKTYGVLEHIKKPIDTEDITDLLDEYFN